MTMSRYPSVQSSHLKTIPFTSVSGMSLQINVMEEEFKNGLMVRNISAIGKTIIQTEKEN